MADVAIDLRDPLEGCEMRGRLGRRAIVRVDLSESGVQPHTAALYAPLDAGAEPVRQYRRYFGAD
jgi:hypothetical protein